MTTLAALEAINLEQLATQTDRVLLLGGSYAARPSRPALAVNLDANDELTLYVRSTPRPRRPGARAPGAWRTFAVSSLCVALVAVSASIASLL